MNPLFFASWRCTWRRSWWRMGPISSSPFQAEPAEGKEGWLFRFERLAAERLSLPAALTVPFTGAGMVLVAGINPTTRFWLWASIVLYLGTLVYLVARQRPGVIRLLRGDRSAGRLQQLRLASVGVLAVILAIGAMMMAKPGQN
jgi:hypothetical protein